MRMRRKKWARPELEACPYFIEEPDRFRGHWREQFSAQQPLHVELGCGKGVSTCCMIHENPGVNYIAIDLISDVLGVARRNIEREFDGAPVNNALLFSKEITRIRETFAPEDRVERLYIHFPNPWCKRAKQHKRRLTHPRQLMQYRDFLVDGGEIWFKTDDRLLFLTSKRYLAKCGFSIRYETQDLHTSGFEPNYVSEHEALFSGKGCPIYFLIAVKEDLPVPPENLDDDLDEEE